MEIRKAKKVDETAYIKTISEMIVHEVLRDFLSWKLRKAQACNAFKA